MSSKQLHVFPQLVNLAAFLWLVTQKNVPGCSLIILLISTYLPLNDLPTDSFFESSQDPVCSPVLFFSISSLSYLLWAFLSSSWNILSVIECQWRQSPLWDAPAGNCGSCIHQNKHPDQDDGYNYHDSLQACLNYRGKWSHNECYEGMIDHCSLQLKQLWN